MSCKFLIFMLIFLSLGTVFSQTPVPGGNVSGTWTLAGTPYQINDEITIPFDSTLTIEPGVVVEFQGHYKLNVQGRLLAIGTETDTIVFTTNDTTGFSNPDIPDGGWHGIRFIYTSSGNDSSKIIYCRLQYGKAVGSSWYNNSGGAICVAGFDKLLISHCLITNNSAGGTDYPAGGGILISSCSSRLVGNTISNNNAHEGGGIEFYNSDAMLINNIFVNNSAGDGGGGGLLIKDNCNVSLINNSLVNNSSGHGGGIISWGNSIIFLDKVDIIGNTALTEVGGGISIFEGSNITMHNCNVVENTASNGGGGGIFSSDCSPLIINCTICNNHGFEGSGGIVCEDSDPILINTILYGNTSPQVQLWDSASEPSFYYCDVEGGVGAFTGHNNIDADPLFQAVADSAYYLSDASPCIGSGIDTLEINGNWYYAPTTDIEGNPRPNPPGSNPDMGAYENSIGHMGPNILITIDTLNFGYVYLGDYDSLELIVGNNGTEDLLISSVLAEPDVFSVTPSFASLDPLEEELFKVTFTPAEVGNYLGLLTLANNDPDSSNFHVALMGTGKEADSAIVMPVYNSLREASWGEYVFLQEVSSDAIFVPTRGVDWYDGGVWRELQEHTWTPTHSHVNEAWMGAYSGIASANSAIDFLKSSPGDSLIISSLIAEARFLRAFYYWWLLDLFRNVPLVTDPTPDPNNPPAQNTPLEVFNFIVTEINAALPDFEESFGEENYGRVTKGAANALLATVYLNAEVYTGTAMWTECVAACDAVINSGNYDLMSTFNDVFALENEGPGNVENILVVVHRPETGFGFLRQMATLHYNQLPSSPWNGFSVLAEFYNAFDTSDVRIDQLLVGPQVVLGGPNAGEPAFDRLGNPLIFTVESPLIGATEGNGVRMLKWPVDPNASGGDAGNDYAIFRYSHILLAKAEAQFMLGATGDALALVNYVRERAFEPDEPLASITLDDILAERGFELLWEGFRRQDLIRTGHFLEAWTLKEASDEFRKIFPIPQFQLDANPNLVQNPEGPVGIPITDGQNLLPEVYALRQNYPNPFNPSTKIQFALPKPESVKIKVYNIIGQKIETLLNQHMKAGYHEVEFNGQNLSSGIYYYRIESGEFQDVKKMILLK